MHDAVKIWSRRPSALLGGWPGGLVGGWPGGLVARALAGVLACAAGLAQAQSQGTPLPPGTLLLGEVMHVLTRELVNSRQIAPGVALDSLPRMLEVRQITDRQIDDGRVVVVRTMIYWNNTASGIKRPVWQPEPLADGLSVAPGNVVELRLQPKGAMVERVRAASLAEGNCAYRELPIHPLVEAMGALSLVGPRGSASLHCPGIEQEGWQRPRSLWHKLPEPPPAPAPAPAPASGPAPASTPVPDPSAEPARRDAP